MRYKPTSYRLPDDVTAALKLAAGRDLRSTTKQLERYIREGLERDGIQVETASAEAR
jgi:hypothetical protein